MQRIKQQRKTEEEKEKVERLIQNHINPYSRSFYSVASGKHENFEDLFYFIFDEGPFLIKNIFPGMSDVPVGLIGVGEKGNLSVKLSVKTCPPTHSSMPSTVAQTNIGILSRAINRLENNPFPSNTSMFVQSSLFIGNYLPLLYRVIFSNFSVFGAVFRKFAASKPPLAATIRTTTAITVVRAGGKINIIPGEATAFVNHRVHSSILNEITVDCESRQTDIEQVKAAVIKKMIDYDRKIINDDRVAVTILGDIDNFTLPSPVTPIESRQFAAIQDCIESTFQAPSSPGLMVGNTDTQHYWRLSKNIFRFTPIVFERLEETKMFHGNDERVSGDNLVKLLEFYHTLLTQKL